MLTRSGFQAFCPQWLSSEPPPPSCEQTQFSWIYSSFLLVFPSKQPEDL